MTIEALDELTSGRHGIKRKTTQVFTVQVHRLREFMGADAIETVPGIGYRLSPLGRLLCDEAIESRRA